MKKKLILAGILGTIGMFVWSSVAHMLLPLGEAGVKQISNEQALLASMSSTLAGSSGLYMFPALGGASMDEYGKKLATNPSGLMVYHPAGTTQAFARMLTVEFLTELLLSFLAAYLLSRTNIGSYAERVGFVTIVGVVAAVSTNVSYWNFYGFPAAYTIPYMTTELVGFIVAGLIAAAILKPVAGAMSATA